jgi:hypothetical protein
MAFGESAKEYDFHALQVKIAEKCLITSLQELQGMMGSETFPTPI